MTAPFIWLIRHAETEWSRTGRHTSRTDLPLTPDGERMARGLAPIVEHRAFSRVWSSPLQRARKTCEIVGLAPRMEIDPDLTEWDYGAYEGVTTEAIQREVPGWDLWRHGCPRGETLDAVRRRADRVLDRVLMALRESPATTAHDSAKSATALDRSGAAGDIALFSHGHFLRVFLTAWLELPASRGRSFGLHADSVSILGFEHSSRVIWSWDWTEHLFARGH
ncbi:MAG: histidine phosphatase family protein [Phycisphaeraceae bacterium]|nr:histidine phosphatase family protein [Phycisphaeraceae bacterium]